MKLFIKIFLSFLIFILTVFSCSVDTEITTEALLSCENDEDCPNDWNCDKQESLCIAPGKELSDYIEQKDSGTIDTDDNNDDEIYREEDKAELCGAYYDKAVECERETSKTLGDAYSNFYKSRNEFINDLCVPELFEDISDEEIDERLGQFSLINIASCSLYAKEICALFPQEKGFQTNCEQY